MLFIGNQCFLSIELIVLVLAVLALLKVTFDKFRDKFRNTVNEVPNVNPNANPDINPNVNQVHAIYYKL